LRTSWPSHTSTERRQWWTKRQQSTIPRVMRGPARSKKCFRSDHTRKSTTAGHRWRNIPFTLTIRPARGSECNRLFSSVDVIFWKWMTELSTLYRPVGQAEFELVRASGFRSFPPRLRHQPIFYPVLSEQYATQIARDWNTRDEASGFVGYVLRFSVRTEFLTHYETHIVGSSEHREYWIPAEDVQKLNENIVGPIEIISEFRGN